MLVTHEHTDHVPPLATLTKQLGVPVYATAPTLDRLRKKSSTGAAGPDAGGRHPEFQAGGIVGGVLLHLRRRGQCRLRRHRRRGAMALATDLGHLTPQVDAEGGGPVLVEANHDVDWVLSGPYLPYLKHRIWVTSATCPMRPAASCAASWPNTALKSWCWPTCPTRTPHTAGEVVSRLSALGCGMLARRSPPSECGALYRLERGQNSGTFRNRGSSIC